MLDFDESFVDSLAANTAAIKNGRGLFLKGKFLNLHKDSDETVIFAECKGSGAGLYQVSVDFIRADQPVFRCSCPVFKKPCKHNLGLMYAWLAKPNFSVANIPESVEVAREKAEVRIEKKAAKAATPPKVDKSALKKKLQGQLEGLDLLEKMIKDIIIHGLGHLNSQTTTSIQEQAVQLGNLHLPGAQRALLNFLGLFYDYSDNFNGQLSVAQKEKAYSVSMDELSRLSAICRKGRAYLETRLEDEELAPETNSRIAEWLGHAWKLAELKAACLIEEETELVQLYFNNLDLSVQSVFIDLGVWVSLKNGKVYVTKNIRPYHAAGFISEDDSYMGVASIKELMIYPGELNPRVRWDAMQPSRLLVEHISKIRAYADESLANLIKTVRQQLKDPLAERSPLVLFKCKRLGKIGDDLFLEDNAGQRVKLSERSEFEDAETCSFLNSIGSSGVDNQVLLLRFYNDLEKDELTAKPLSLIQETQIVRLAY
jgi:hypothetical protein